MDRAFSRRSFMKYTALMTVAVAGSSLLSGCSVGEHPVQTEIGTTNTALKVKSTLESAAFDPSSSSTGSLKFRFKVYNGRVNDIGLDPSNFFVKSGSFRSYNDGKIRVTFIQTEDSVVNPQIKRGQTAIVEIEVIGLSSLEEDETVTLTYYPDTQYAELASSSWMLDSRAFASTEGTPSEELS